jgi:hypothetical protein
LWGIRGVDSYIKDDLDEMETIPMEQTQDTLGATLREWKRAEIIPYDIAPDKLEILNRFHQIGHFGQRAMHEQLRAHNYQWVGMQRDIATFTDSCDICLRWNISKKIYNGLRSINAKLPFDHLQIDLITSFDVTTRGNRYILVVVDIFSGYSILRTLKDKSASSVSDVLWEIFGSFGIPKIIQSDNGTEFTSTIITSMLSKLKIVNRQITAYNHQANGKVENTNKTVSLCLRKLLDQYGGEWDRWLPVVALAMNAKIRDLTGFSPIFLMFNRHTNLFDDTDSEENLHEQEPLDLDAWISHQNGILTSLFPLVCEMVKSKQLKQKITYDKLHNVKDQVKVIPIDTIVYLLDVVRAGKNQPPYVGPYKVVEMTPEGHFKIQDTVGALYHRIVEIKELKITHSSLPFGNNDYYVERILDHKLDKKNDSWLYRIRWTGLDHSYDKWVAAKFIESSIINKYTATLSRLPKRPSTKEAEKRSASEMLLGSVATESVPVVVATKKAKGTNKRKSKAKKIDIAPSVKEFKKRTR